MYIIQQSTRIMWRQSKEDNFEELVDHPLRISTNAWNHFDRDNYPDSKDDRALVVVH